ncbi:HlyD family secretion protein [Desulfolutivibrio sulfoxidireducens]|uniref:HlyD family secretion protein n=1 Tax=Desulfolutivibrio sulfoxidireducens TaxID=2773299 RepID=UPI00159E5D88|nr:HlyD family efflux transporter periplasmic adaptor subunit [Desulfolutivibrio sulfoxidireducens]QLA15853.1 HlyD family efflux transporter periplasmic adaptor subunit [Desulfolutivibrio sulfoxidireducens]
MPDSGKIGPHGLGVPARACRSGRKGLAVWAALAVALTALAGCGQTPGDVLPGYVEGEFVYVASKFAGRLDAMGVSKGGRVEAGAPLFTLEHEFERQALDLARADLAQAEDTLRDKEKGLRPEEIDQIEASLQRSRAELALAKLERERRETLFSSATISQEELDNARTEHARSQAVVREYEAKLATGKLSDRVDRVLAARAAVDAARLGVDQAKWNLDQKIQTAPVSGLVFDTLHYVGEWVGASSPVVSLLPPENIKVRFFVPEAELARIRPGDRVLVGRDGLPEPAEAVVDYVSTQAEYAPPVIFSQGFREKLVFLVEARFSPDVARDMHPGQPVDVRLDRPIPGGKWS